MQHFNQHFKTCLRNKRDTFHFFKSLSVASPPPPPSERTILVGTLPIVFLKEALSHLLRFFSPIQIPQNLLLFSDKW